MQQSRQSPDSDNMMQRRVGIFRSDTSVRRYSETRSLGGTRSRTTYKRGSLPLTSLDMPSGSPKISRPSASLDMPSGSPKISRPSTSLDLPRGGTENSRTPTSQVYQNFMLYNFFTLSRGLHTVMPLRSAKLSTCCYFSSKNISDKKKF